MARKKSNQKPKAVPENPWDEAYIESLAWHTDYIKDARKVLKKGGFGTVESRADGRGWWVECQGMTDTYQVSVRPDPASGFVATCSCPSNKNPCKHALALLLYLAAHPEERIEPVAASSAKSADLDALVRAVFENPDDDTPRLILADCAEELGQPARAALIRLQCEKARTGPHDRYKELEEEEKKLMPAVRAEMGPIPDNLTATFRRGFITLRTEEGMWTGWGHDLNALPAKFPELFRDGWVEAVSLAHAHYLPTWLFGLLRQVREVQFAHRYGYESMDDRELVQIASELRPGLDGARLKSVQVPTRHRERLRELSEVAASDEAPVAGDTNWLAPVGDSAYRTFDNLNARQLALLVHAGHLRDAHYLTLRGEIGDTGIDTLLSTPGLEGLVSLELTNSGVGPVGLKALAASPLAARLQTLAINEATNGDDLVSALRGGKWSRLERLTLSTVGLTDAGASALSQCDFPKLKSLDLSNNALTRDGAAGLLDAAPLAGVKDWALSGNPIPAAEWIPLTLSGSRTGGTIHFERFMTDLAHTLDKPNELHLGLTGAGEAIPGLFDGWTTAARPVVSLQISKLRFDVLGVKLLVDGLVSRGVKELHLINSELRNEVAIPLVARLAEMKLDVLDLRDNEIGKHGADALAASPGLATVRVLTLSGNPLRPSGVDAIVPSPHLKALERISLPGKDVPLKRQQEIRAKLGKGIVVEFF